MDLDLLPMFAVFADTCSFTRTAESLGLTQPAVHGQVKRLTEAVGEPLYVRSGRGVTLTPRGQSLAALARDVVRTRDHFLGDSRPLRLAAGRGVWSTLLMERAGPWLVAHGVVPIVADGPSAVQAVHEGRADLGIAAHSPNGLVSMELWRVGTDLLVPPDHALATRDEVSTRDLDGLEWILPSSGRPHHLAVSSALSRAGFHASVALECNDWALMAGFVGLGLGVAAVNDCVPASGVARLPWRDGPQVVFWLFWRPTRRPSAIDDLAQYTAV